MHAAAAAKSLQSCPTLCDPRDGSPPGSPVPGILQARTLAWGAIAFCNAWKWRVKVKLLSCVRLFATPWTAAYQAPPPMGFSRQGYWSGMPLPPLATTSGKPQIASGSWKENGLPFRALKRHLSLEKCWLITPWSQPSVGLTVRLISDFWLPEVWDNTLALFNLLNSHISL